MHINELKPLALKLVLETFLKAQEIGSLHIQIDNIGNENGGNEKFRNGLSFQATLGTAIKKKVAAEYITSELNWHADKQSCCKTRS